MKVIIFILAILATTLARPYHLDVPTPPGNSFTSFMKGFLEGINQKGDINKLLDCIHSGEHIIEEIKAALELIAKKDFNSIIAGVTMLIQAVKELMDALKPCMTGFDQLKKLMDAITHADIKKIAMKILFNLNEFISEVMNAVNCFHSNDYYCGGKNVGIILRKLFLEDALEQANPGADFLKGFLIGIHETKTVNDLLKCVGDMNPIIAEIRAALELMLKMTLNDVISGLKLLLKAMLDVEKMLQPCLEGFHHLKKLLDAIKNANIISIAWNIIRNANSFIHDFNDCIDSLKNGNFTQAGKDIGDLLYRMFLGHTQQLKFNVADFLKGFLEGLNEKGDVNKLLKCVKDIDRIIKEIEQGLRYIKKKDMSNVIKGLTMVLQAVNELLSDLQPCSEGFDQIKKLFEAFKHIDILKLVFKILANPGPYIQDVMDCINSFEKGDAYNAGKDLGDFLYRLFLTGAVAELNFDDILSMINGFLKAINQEGNFDNIEQCIDDIPIVIQDVKTAIELFKKIDWKNLDKIIDAILSISSAFTKILESIKPCSKIPTDIDYILQKFKNIDVNKLLQKFMTNMITIIHEMTQAINDLVKENYEAFGDTIGKIFYLIFLKD